MSADKSTFIANDQAEPRAELATVPIWVIILLAMVLYAGALYFDENGAWFKPEVYAPYHSVAQLDNYQLPSAGNERLQNGKRLFDQICALCHNPDGEGKPNQAPPFVGSQWVLGTPDRLIRIPLVGLQSPIDVAGKTYSFASSMPAMGAALSDGDLADVLTYMRSSWGNKAAPITADQVKAIRAKIAGRTQ
ncbi:MAG TPA: cytochrome c, partial [Verrucomicrobiae bacterium]|nr:cytochrome c [Verrucomicrobiae bacterium]